MERKQILEILDVLDGIKVSLLQSPHRTLIPFNQIEQGDTSTS